MNRVVLLHGMNKKPEDVWYPWIQQQCAAKGLECVVPEMPYAESPVLPDWLAVVDAQKPDKDTILVGHSRGGMAILRWLEQPGHTAKRAILVAANSATIEDAAKGSFYSGPYDFAAITANCPEFVLLHSKDDPWIPYRAAEENAAGLNGKLITFEDKQHFGEGQADGKPLTEFPELLAEILR